MFSFSGLVWSPSSFTTVSFPATTEANPVNRMVHKDRHQFFSCIPSIMKVCGPFFAMVQAPWFKAAEKNPPLVGPYK